MFNRPWYSIKGRGNRDYIERLISSKREKEARNTESKCRNRTYFDNWQRQNEWTDRKGCKKSPVSKISKETTGGKRISIKVPYDLDYEPVDRDPVVNEQVKAKRQSVREEIRILYQKLMNLDKQSTKLEKEETFYIKQIEDLLFLRKQLKDKQGNWTIQEKKIYYKRFARDKLRLKTFLVCEQLNNYKLIIGCIHKPASSLYCSKRETRELDGLIESSLDIINMYLDVNYKRNYGFILLFNEEAEKKWMEQEANWTQERLVWYNLVYRVIEAFFTVYKCKLENNIDSQMTLQKNQADLLNQISVMKEKLKKDPDLIAIVNEDLKPEPYP